ncbi:MAG: type II 3-dehydroquinate dehydratase [Alphaproteobacteria bacterium]|jgi:3-dehydroquinate dehydratase-2|nr:type II 3-dehydroquinate dehydratase [Alphaproteobacteria bacterium]
MSKILIINGANLNLLGQREPNIYGNFTLDDLEKLCIAKASSCNSEVIFFQSNLEGELINKIHSGYSQGITKLIINAGGFSHTSIALMDAIIATKMQTIEVHISNIYKREDFRHNSYISKVANGTICGLGADGYLLAIEYLSKN